MSVRSFLFGPPEPSPAAVDLGLLVLRVGVGLPLALAHGLRKLPPSPGFVETTGALGFPVPGLFAWAAALSEFAGGLLLAAGLLTRPAAFFVVATLSVAFFGQHAGDSFGDRERALLYIIPALALIVTGAGRYALDAVLARGRRRRW